MSEDKEFNNNYKQHRSYIHHVIGRYISDACTVDDLTQNTFMKAWLARHTFRGDSAYRTWLHRIAVNTALGYLVSFKEKSYRYRYSFNDYDFKSQDDVLEDNITYEEIESIQKAIEELPTNMRNAIILYTIYGMSYEQLAEMYEIPIGTIRSRLHRARYILKNALK